VSIFDWLGPLNAGGKRRGWDALPPVATEAKSYPYIDDIRVVITSPLVSGPGASDALTSWRKGDGNSAVYACLQVIATAIAEPELKVYRLAKGERVEQDGTPLGNLLSAPNPHMTLDMLLAYLSNCLKVEGNGYWRKLRAGNPETGNVVELWPISPCRIEPRTQSGSGDFISFYRYYVRPGVYEDIAPENVVHFRDGLDDRDHRVGCSALKKLAREVSSDDQATRYADRLLANFAAPGLSVEFDKDAEITKAAADEIKARIQAAYSGDNVGAVSVLSPGAKLSAHGFSPEQMDMKTLHRFPEERISAVLRVPAIVAGLGAGLDHATYANYEQAREAFTEDTLIPLWRSVAATITLQLLPDFTRDRTMLVDFDTDEVRALATDENAKAIRLQGLVVAGILTVDEARAELGHEPKAAPSLPAPAATRSRPRLLDLPNYQGVQTRDWQEVRLRPNEDGVVMWGRPEVKALDDLPGEYDALKDDRLPDWESELRSYLDAQLRRVNARLRAGGDTADALVVEGEATLLGETLQPLQISLLSDVSRLVVSELGVAFDLDDPSTRAYLQAAGSNIVGITDTTREAVRGALIAGQQAGDGVEQLARRLRDLPAFGDRRARLVARTELGHASNTAALANYRGSGVVVGVRVFDGDYDAECAAMNGRVFNLGQEPATLQHPNCRRAFAPIVDSSELTRSA
jgi:HK97 family phage portal protein